MIRFILYHLLLFICVSVSTAQKIPVRCAHDSKVKPWMKQTPGYEENLYKGFEEFNKKQGEIRQSGGVIPVHVIIVHPPGQNIGTGQNFSLEHILSQIEVLNQDFGRYNPDSTNTPLIFPATNTGIQFCLANVDPNGNPTNGITRYAFNGNFDDNEFNIKQISGWPRESYLNIWSAPGIEDLGYAYLPTQTFLPNPVLDGVVIHSAAFGGPGFGTYIPYHLGRTGSHEVGHYLGLLHTWFEAGCIGDDGILDTPLQDDENFGCPVHPAPSCTNNGDMFMNYMDYVNDNCMNAFTAGQGAYMRSILSGIRSTLLDSNNTACSETVPLGVTVNTQNITCFGYMDGKVIAEVEGGLAPYLFSLGNGNTNNNGIFEDLTTGNYTLVVTDAGNQIFSQNFELTEPQKIQLHLDTLIQPLCFGHISGKVLIYAEGGTQLNGYLFELNGDEINNSGIFENLANGIHTINVYDDNQCFESIEVEIYSPGPILWDTIDFQNVLCYGDSTGKCTISASGGSGGFEYRIEDQFFSNQNKFSDLKEGKYIFEIRDMNQCLIRDSFFINEPPPLVVNIEVIEFLRCPRDTNATIQILASGGTPPYLFGIEDEADRTSNFFNNLKSGDYPFVVKDVNQCSNKTEYSISEPAEIIIQDTFLRLPDCGTSNGEIHITAQGGTGNQYLYRIGNFQYPEGKFIGLKTDIYHLTIYDENQCFEIFEIHLKENTNLTIQIDTTHDVNCFGDNTGYIFVSGHQGIGSLIYQLGNNIQETGDFTELHAGSYMVEVVDSVGCKQKITVHIKEPDHPLILNILELTPGNNPGEGKINVEASGGTPPYVYSMDGVIFSSGNVFENLNPGTFVVYTRDSLNCTIHMEVQLSGLDHVLRGEHYRIWPNPVHEKLYISCKKNTIGNIQFFNIFGQNTDVPVTTFSLMPGEEQIEIDVALLPSGIYILLLSQNGKMVLNIPILKL